jgi:hypothetical protein
VTAVNKHEHIDLNFLNSAFNNNIKIINWNKKENVAVVQVTGALSILKPEKTNWRGIISTVDLLFKVACCLKKWVIFSVCKIVDLNSMRKDCFQNKSKFITEDHFTKHMNITIR